METRRDKFRDYQFEVAQLQSIESEKRQEYEIYKQAEKEKNDLEWSILEKKYGVNQQEAEKARDVAMSNVDEERKKYRYEKDKEDKIIFSQMDQESQKSMMEFENKLKADYYNQTK